MKKTKTYIGKFFNHHHNTTQSKDASHIPPWDVTSSQVPKSSGDSPGHQSSGTIHSTSFEPPQMFAHASHFKISESVFATGPVSVTYAAARNIEEILKVSHKIKKTQQILYNTRNMF